MERVISQEERIKRAEDIYYRRRNQNTRVLGTSVNIGNKPKVSLGKKMSIQILICMCVYLFFVVLKTYNNIFSENVINQTKIILSYDINLSENYNKCKEYFEKNINKIINSNNSNNQENTDNKNENSEFQENSVTNESNQDNIQDNSQEIIQENNQINQNSVIDLEGQLNSEIR